MMWLLIGTALAGSFRSSPPSRLPTADAVSQGLHARHRILQAFGERESMGTTVTGEDIWRGTATTIPTPAAAGEQLEVVSTDAGDDADGGGATGILTLKVNYLDASGDEQSETVTMDGLTPVALAASDVRFVQDMHALTVGATGVADGVITIYKQGASSTIYNMIDAGGNLSMVPHRMVPAGHTLWLRGWHCEEAQNKRVAFRIRSTDRDGTLLPGVFCFKDVAYLNGSSTGPLQAYAEIPALSVVKVSGWGDAIGAEASCSWWGILEEL